MQDYHSVHKDNNRLCKTRLSLCSQRNNNMQDYHSVHEDNNMQDYHFVHKTIISRLSLCSQEYLETIICKIITLFTRISRIQ